MPVNYFEEKKKKQKSLIIVFIIVIFLVFLVLYFGYYKKGKSGTSTYNYSQENAYPEKVGINFNILESQKLKDLKSFKKITSFQGKKGRDNPFLPY